MRFTGIQRFIGGTQQDTLKYLRGLEGQFRSLFIGLSRLSVVENMDGFLFEGTIANGTTVTITNPLGQIPSGRIILGARATGAGTVIITDSLTAWTQEAVYLENVGSVSAVVKVFFLR